MTEVEGRRPLNSRNWRLFQRLAAWMATTRLTPNMISVSSVVFGALGGLALLATSMCVGWIQGAFFIAAASSIQLRLVANLMDGMVAVEGGKRSAVGLLYNEVPDRFSDAFIMIGAGYSVGQCPTLGWWAALVAVFVAYVRAIGSSAGVGEVFAGPMAKPQRMALMTVGCVAWAAMSLIANDAAAQWQVWTIQGVLTVVIAGGIITSVRRLRIIASRMREADQRGLAEATE